MATGETTTQPKTGRVSSRSRRSSAESLKLPFITATPRHYGRRDRGYISPLAEPQVLVPIVKKKTSAKKLRDMEVNFINDAIWTNFYMVPRKIPIIPHYDAIVDPASQGYFDSHVAQGVVRKTRPEILADDDQGSNHGSSYSHRSNDSARSRMSSLSRLSTKLSARRKVPRSPSSEELRRREESFLNDGIQTERRRTKYKDIIPPYDASTDVFAQKTAAPRRSTINIYSQLRRNDSSVSVRSSHSKSPQRGRRRQSIRDERSREPSGDRKATGRRSRATNGSSRRHDPKKE